jgi:tetratricopeptide (TPR) repeat protein
MASGVPHRATSPAAALAAALALAAAAYGRVLHGELQLDDSITIEQNLAVKDLAGYVSDHLAHEVLGGGRPVTNLTFALNYAAGRLDPWGYHLANVGIHLAVAVLVFLFTRAVLRLAGAGRADGLAAAVAGAFALHPLQSEAVSYVTQRSEALASGLTLAALLLVLAAERRGATWRGGALLAAGFATFVLALGAKPIALTMPAAWLLLAWAVPAPEGRGALLSWPRRLLAVAPFLAVEVPYAAGILRSIEGSGHAGFSVAGLSPWTYLLTQLRAVATYLRLLLWPAGQNVDWDFPVSRSLAEPAVLLCGLLLASLAGGAVALVLSARRLRGEPAGGAARVAGFGVLFFLLALSPTSTVVPLADVLGEHRVYLAAWGILTAIAVAGERVVAWAERLGKRRAALGGAVVIAAVWAALALALHRRNAVWETQLALMSDAVAKSPEKAGPHLSLGYALRVAGRHDEAIAEYRKALPCARDEAEAMKIVRNLGAALIWAGRNDEAIGVLEQALPEAPRDSDLLTNLAVAWGAKGNAELARFYAHAAVAADPDQGGAWNLLGRLALGDDDLPTARDALERAVALDPDAGIRHYNLGRVLERQRNLEGACAEWGRALEVNLEGPKRAEIERIVQRTCAR